MKNTHILLFTDDPETGIAVANAAQACEATLSISKTSSQTLQQFDAPADDADIVFIDLEPVAQQLSLLVSLRQRRPEVPVVVFTEADDRHVGGIALADGATDCLEKPLRGDALRRMIDRLSANLPGREPAWVCDL